MTLFPQRALFRGPGSWAFWQKVQINPDTDWENRALKPKQMEVPMDTSSSNQQWIGSPGAIEGWTEAEATYLPQEQPVTPCLALTHGLPSQTIVRLRCHDNLWVAIAFHLLTELRGERTSSGNCMPGDNFPKRRHCQSPLNPQGCQS